LWWGDLSEGDNLKNLGVEGRVILKWILNRWIRGMDATALSLSQDKGRWQVFVNAVMNLRVSLNTGNFLTR